MPPISPAGEVKVPRVIKYGEFSLLTRDLLNQTLELRAGEAKERPKKRYTESTFFFLLPRCFLPSKSLLLFLSKASFEVNLTGWELPEGIHLIFLAALWVVCHRFISGCLGFVELIACGSLMCSHPSSCQIRHCLVF